MPYYRKSAHGAGSQTIQVAEAAKVHWFRKVHVSVLVAAAGKVFYMSEGGSNTKIAGTTIPLDLTGVFVIDPPEALPIATAGNLLAFTTDGGTVDVIIEYYAGHPGGK
jgi:hypothetical protein